MHPQSDEPLNTIGVVNEYLPTPGVDPLEECRKAFESCVDAQQLQRYRLPASNHTRVIIGLSGGADSTVLALFAALYLAPHYPTIEFIFTDTKAEPDSCYQTLDKLESITGMPITRVTPTKGLFELIDQYNGFLPSPRQRWCTRELKLKPILAAINLQGNVISLAGIRADEPDREGLSLSYSLESESKTAFPFVDLGVTREHVFNILSRTPIGVPSSYYYRSRSGCFSCPFLRTSELIGTLLANPAEFARGEAAERLSPHDCARWDNIPAGPGIGFYATYPVPDFMDLRKAGAHALPHPKLTPLTRAGDDKSQDMFAGLESPAIAPEQPLYAAYALYCDPMLSTFGDSQFSPGVYWSEFITLSTSYAGIKASLGNYITFRQSTPMPRYDIAHLRIVIVRLVFPHGVIDPYPPSKESYTWKAGIAYKQIRHLLAHVQATLARSALERQRQDARSALKSAIKRGDYDAAMLALELWTGARQQLKASPPPCGRVAWEGLYTPIVTEKQVQLELTGLSPAPTGNRAREGLEFDEVIRPCVVCSI